MNSERVRVEVDHDHLRKLTAAGPMQALAELIWNALDADARRVDVEVESGKLGLSAVTVRDNGHGFEHGDVKALFGRVGGSWKRHGSRSRRDGRRLHGKEGKGRFKALALGRVADWTVRYPTDEGLLGFKMSLIRDDLENVRITSPSEVDPALNAGVEVRITELDRQFTSLRPESAIPDLSAIFATYLTEYEEARVFFDGEELRPDAYIKDRVSFELKPITVDDREYPVVLDVIQWTSTPERSVFLCGSDGFPFLRIAPRFHTPGFIFSAYLKSPYIDFLQERGTIDLAEMDARMASAYEEAAEQVKRYFQAKEVSAAKAEIDGWKAERSYPYEAEPETPVEVAERQVFDIVALTVSRHLDDFADQSRQSRAFQMRMLRQAIERGPDELQHILTEVLNLPRRKQAEFSRLLREADLANVISASRMVADRLKFLTGIEHILYNPETRGLLKERSQLHRMLAENNTWIFGEEFSLTVDDKGLTEVLRKHQKLIGDDTIIDDPVKRVSGKTGIVDLMISRSVPLSRANEREHLIIELKRPSVVIGANEITQIEEYAVAIAEDERFRDLKTRWTFWVVSNDLDAHARRRTQQSGSPPGRIWKEGDVEIWVRPWSEILADCKGRMRFVQEHLKANVDNSSALGYLREKYGKYVSGVIEEPFEDGDEIDDVIDESAAETADERVLGEC